MELYPLLYSIMVTFRDSNKSFKLDGDLLETMTNYDFNVSLPNPQHQKLNTSSEKNWILALSEQDKKVTEINLLLN